MKRFTIAVTTLIAVSFLVASQAEAKCGSHGGPGYRKANGKCASWKG